MEDDRSHQLAWARSENGIAYPPAPWRLGGSLVASLWSIRRRDLPSAILDDRLPTQRWFGRCVLATGFAVYEPGGVLAYDELLLALRVRASGRGMVNVPRIWVDSSASIAGARALWSVPKESADFSADHSTSGDDARTERRFEARREEGILARMCFRRRVALPGWWRASTSIAQMDGDGLKITQVQALSRIAIGSARWDFPPESPLAFLRGHRPVVSLRLHRMTMAFGI